MPTIQKTEAIIIKCRDYTESSQLVSFFTKHFGKLSMIAKGSRGRTGKFKGKLDLLNRYELVFYRSARGELHLLTEYTVLESFTVIRGDLNKMAAVTYLTELLAATVGFDDSHRSLYNHMIEILRMIDQGVDYNWCKLIFEIRLFKLLGLLPQMKLCVTCRAALKETGFLQPGAGWFCPRCARGKKLSSKGVFALLADIARSSRLKSWKMFPGQQKELNNILRLMIDYSIGKRLKSLDFFEEINHG